MRLVLSESQSQCVTLPEASLLLRETDGMDTIVAAHVVSIGWLNHLSKFATGGGGWTQPAEAFALL